MRVAERQLPQHNRGVGPRREARDVAVLAGEIGGPPPCLRVSVDVGVVPRVALGDVVEDEIEVSVERLVEGADSAAGTFIWASDGLEFVTSSSVPHTLRWYASSTRGASWSRSAINRSANARASPTACACSR